MEMVTVVVAMTVVALAGVLQTARCPK